MRVMQHGGYSRVGAQLLTILLLAAALLVLGGCNTRGGSVPYEPATFGRPDNESIAPSAEQGPLRIGALDKVKVSVFQVPDLTGEFQVDSSGSIDFPLVGAIPAQGRTPEELRQLLTARLGERYLQNPNVQVSLSERSEQHITVDGSVNSPGMFVVKGTTTLMRAVAMAKGTSADANPSRVIVFRTIRGERMAGAFDLSDIRRAKSEDPVLYGNDIVIVDGSRAQKLFSQLMGSLPLLSILRPY